MEKTTLISVTPQIAKYINTLIERDEPKMAKLYMVGDTNKPAGLICPNCAGLIATDSLFCYMCGQRIDSELTEL